MPGDLAIGQTAIPTTGSSKGLQMPKPVGAIARLGPFAWATTAIWSTQAEALRSSLDHLAVNSPPNRFRADRLLRSGGGLDGGLVGGGDQGGGKASAVGEPSAWQSVTPEGLFALR